MAPVARLRSRLAWTSRRTQAARAGLTGAAAIIGSLAWPVSAAGQSATDLQQMSIEDLGNIEISSVSKTAEPLSDAAAAIYVITHDDIIRSGATSVPEMLRLAPNLQVAQITATNFAITARGFNGPAASKLLVLVDGRSVYTPYHSGVFWDLQDVLPDTVDRIEVISGPGATLWGANAVNGVINIITKRSGETQGGVLKLGAGNMEQRVSLQYGGKLADDLSYRAYVESFYHNQDRTASGTGARDDWNKSQGGFRFDWTPSDDLVTLQGDFYKGSENGPSSAPEATSGHNVLARWNHGFDDGSALQIQAYYDHLGLSVAGVASDTLDTYDIDVQHSFSWGTDQSIVWGGGYRVEQDNFPTMLSPTQPLFFSPQSRTLTYGNIFVQDTIALTDRLKLTLGTKLEDEPYTGIEALPSARLSWKVTESDLLWAAISRAVRAPSRLDRDLFEEIGPILVIKGDDFQPEKLLAYEIGYRGQLSQQASMSLSAFYDDYTDLRSAEFSPGPRLPAMFENMMEGSTYGIELWGNYQVATWWRLAAGANWLHKNLHFKPGSSRIAGIGIAGNDPRYQFSIRSTMDVAPDWVLELDLRKIGSLPDPASPTYTELDGRIGWTVSPWLEISLTGANLLHPRHLEFGTTVAPLQLGSTGVETGRSFFLDTKWRF